MVADRVCVCLAGKERRMESPESVIRRVIHEADPQISPTLRRESDVERGLRAAGCRTRARRREEEASSEN